MGATSWSGFYRMAGGADSLALRESCLLAVGRLMRSGKDFEKLIDGGLNRFVDWLQVILFRANGKLERLAADGEAHDGLRVFGHESFFIFEFGKFLPGFGDLTGQGFHFLKF